MNYNFQLKFINKTHFKEERSQSSLITFLQLVPVVVSKVPDQVHGLDDVTLLDRDFLELDHLVVDNHPLLIQLVHHLEHSEVLLLGPDMVPVGSEYCVTVLVAAQLVEVVIKSDSQVWRYWS